MSRCRDTRSRLCVSAKQNTGLLSGWLRGVRAVLMWEGAEAALFYFIGCYKKVNEDAANSTREGRHIILRFDITVSARRRM